MRNAKKFFAVVLAVTTMAASTLTAFAASPATSTTPATPAVTTPAPAPVNTTSEVKIGGTTVKTTVTGAYSATAIPAAVVTTPVAEIASSLSLKGDEKPFVSTYDVDTKKSYAAYASITGAAEALNVTVGPMVNFDLGIKSGVNFTSIKEPKFDVTAKVTLPIPATFQNAGATYAVVGVYYGGTVVVYDDLDSDPATVTINVPVGMGAYAIVQK